MNLLFIALKVKDKLIKTVQKKDQKQAGYLEYIDTLKQFYYSKKLIIYGVFYWCKSYFLSIRYIWNLSKPFKNITAGAVNSRAEQVIQT